MRSPFDLAIPMTTFVSLLRGINVGGHRRVPMAELRELLGARGLGPVATYIQSGNLVYTPARGSARELSDTIERCIAEHFGFEVPVITRSASQWRRLSEHNPFLERGDCDPAMLHLTLFSAEPTAEAMGALLALENDVDELRPDGAALYVHCPKGISGSKLDLARMERLLGVRATSRNWRTVLKLRDML